MILLILLLRPLLGRRVPARWRYLLWALVLVRLLVPSFILPPSPASLQNIPVVERPGERLTIAFDEAYTDYFMGGKSGVPEPRPVESAAPKPLPVSHPFARRYQMSWWQLGAIVWGTGATMLAAWILGATVRLRRRMRGESTPVDDEVAEIWASCCARFSLSRAPRLLMVQWLGSPALVGIFHPTLLIPDNAAETYSHEDWEHIFMHELAHYRRRDHWTNALQLLALCAHWFNPLVWLGFRFLRADRELAADELALECLAGKGSGPIGERAIAYGDTLLKVLSAHSAEGFQPSMIGIMDDGAQLKQRLRRIVAFGPSPIIGSFAGLGLILVLSVLVLGRASNNTDLSAYGDMKPAEMLVSAAAKNDLPALRKMLDDGIDMNSIANLPGERTALAAAAAADQMEAVRFLVTNGAQVNSQEGKTSPALIAALRNGWLECANYLLAKGAACDPQFLEDAKRDIADRKTGTYLVSTAAERGQILDRNGKVLAANRHVERLGIVFPTLLLSDAEALAFANEQAARAETILHREGSLAFSTEAMLRHYRSRGMLPFDIAEDLTDTEQATLKKAGMPGLAVHSVAVRHYPNGTLGAHFLGFSHPGLRPSEPLRANRISAVEIAGRDGLELTFNDQLAGKPGNTLVAFDAQGRKISEKISSAPQPGNNVVMTIDTEIQSLCEKALHEGGRPGAIVIIDPNNGDVIAMASWPAFDPNTFFPSTSAANWRALNDDPNLPLVDRACGAAYPPGSTFKVFAGLAALESGAIKLDEKIPNPPSIQLGDHTFRDWKDSDRGMLTFGEALEQNANTWFYQAGIRTGAKPMIDWALKFGFSRKTGILPNEKAGVIPTEELMKRRLNKGWAELSSRYTVNLAIGQGYTLVTPLQMAQAMATLANGGTFYQTRLVNQLRNRDGKVIGEYHLPPHDHLNIQPEILAEIKKAMVAAVMGAGRGASLEGIQVAGSTGSAQWGTAGKERAAGWSAGFAPAEQPKYAFAAIYEGAAGEPVSGGANAAPMMGKVLRELFGSENR